MLMPVIRGGPSQLHVSVQGLFLSIFVCLLYPRYFTFFAGAAIITAGRNANEYLPIFISFFDW
jgi:hypothetical protein